MGGESDRIRLWWSLLLTGMLLLGVKLAVADRVGGPFRRPSLAADGTLPGVEQPLSQPYADGMTLIGYDLSCAEMPADGILRIDLYWTVRQQPTRPYQSVVHLLGPDGLLWSPQASARPHGYHDPPPSDSWLPGQYVVDSHEVEPLPGTPPGRYKIVVTLFDRQTLTPVSLLDAAGQPAAPRLTLGELTLTRPRRPVQPPEDALALPLGDFALLRARFDRERAAPGDAVYLTLMWQAQRDGDEAVMPTLSLEGSDGAVTSYPLPVPAPSWRAGDVLRDQRRLVIPATLESGAYTWIVGLAGSSYEIGVLEVDAPQRIFSPPPFEQPLGVTLGGVATLVGFSVEPSSVRPGEEFTATLVWRAEDTPEDALRVFVHLLDPQGGLVDQSDGVPACWSRPTTGWLAGEYIVDPHLLAVPSGLPSGEIVLSAGLYHPDGPRLLSEESSDAIRLTTISVEADE